MEKVKGIMQERTLNLGDLKYVQIHDLDDCFNNVFSLALTFSISYKISIFKQNRKACDTKTIQD